jgi:hypothetical protein
MSTTYHVRQQQYDMKWYYWRESNFKFQANVVYVNTKIVTLLVLNNLQIYLLRLLYTVSHIMNAVHIGDVRVKYNALIRKFFMRVERFRMFHTLIYFVDS